MAELLTDMTKLEEIKEEMQFIIDKKTTAMLVCNVPLIIFHLSIALMLFFSIGWASLVMVAPIGWILVGLILDLYHVRQLRKYAKRFSESWLLKKIPFSIKEE